MTIFLTAPKDLQDATTYEEVLKLLEDTHEGEDVVADRDLFESSKEYRKNWKGVYGKAERLYVLAREDGTVGRGIYQQWRWLSGKGVPAVVLFGGNERGWYERFSLEVVGKREEGEGDDMARYALVRLGSEGL